MAKKYSQVDEVMEENYFVRKTYVEVKKLIERSTTVKSVFEEISIIGSINEIYHLLNATVRVEYIEDDKKTSVTIFGRNEAINVAKTCLEEIIGTRFQEFPRELEGVSK